MAGSEDVLLFCIDARCAAPDKTSLVAEVKPTEENSVSDTSLAVGLSLWLRHIVHLHCVGRPRGRLVSVERQF